MKKFITTSIIALLVAAGTTAMAQNRPKEYLGLPGDNLNLYAVMKLFQESQTLEGFERTLNDENSRINNLDLNGDGLIDYIMVNDYPDGNVHNIVLQVALNKNEKQDVAVFTVQKFANGSVQIQLVGDQALYGPNYIIEPNYADNAGETPNPGYTGGSGYYDNTPVVRYTTFEISAWPLIRFIFLPDYICWHSSWYWDYWPAYWHPWHPFYWDYYYGYHYNMFPYYYGHYRHWEHNRYTRYHDFYYSGIRSHSPQVSRRISEGRYRSTYSHPEQRREGEALYSRTHSSRNTGRAENSVNGNRGQRSVSRTSQVRTSAGTGYGTSRRSYSTSTPGNGSNLSSRQSTNTFRRSNATVIDKSRLSTYSGQNTGTPRKSYATVTDRSRPNTYSGQNTQVRKSGSPVINSNSRNIYSGNNSVNSRRSYASVSSKAVSRPETHNSGVSARSSRQSSPGIRSSGQKGSRETRSSSSVGRSTKTKDSGNSRSSRR